MIVEFVFFSFSCFFIFETVSSYLSSYCQTLMCVFGSWNTLITENAESGCFESSPVWFAVLCSFHFTVDVLPGKVYAEISETEGHSSKLQVFFPTEYRTTIL